MKRNVHRCYRAILAGLAIAAFAVGNAAAQDKPKPPRQKDRFDRSYKIIAPTKYKLSDADIRDLGVSTDIDDPLPHKCFGTVSISDDLLARYTKLGFSTKTACLAIQSPWVTHNPETGKPLTVVYRKEWKPGAPWAAQGFLLNAPPCFKNGKPYHECKFTYSHEGLKFAAGIDGDRNNRFKIDAEVREQIVSGRFDKPCGCGDVELWAPSELRIKLNARCRVGVVSACQAKVSNGNSVEGAMLAEREGYSFEGTSLKGSTGWGWFEIAPSLPGGYAYQIGHPEGDDDSPFLEVAPGDKIRIGD